MARTGIGVAAGALLGIVALALYGAVDGFSHGIVTRPSLTPGPYTACLNAFIFVAYFWWLAGGVGAWIGGLIGLGSAAVRQWMRDRKAA